MRSLLVFAVLFFAFPAQAIVEFDWVTVGDPGNAADIHDAGYGSVAYTYQISKYETTNAQYAEFLNAKAASDPLALYNTSMTSYGITRSGVSGSYNYSVTTGFADKPVVYVSFYDSLRFANWLDNGQGSGDTETGAYTLLGGTAAPSNGLTVTRNAGASIFLTSEDEWYKAAYYDAVSTSYFDYPMGTNTIPGCVAPGSDTGNSANCNLSGASTNVGAYSLSDSPYGTYDQGGNVFEWNEAIIGSDRGVRGGGWGSDHTIYLAAKTQLYRDPTYEYGYFGFRVAMIPEPSTGLLVITGLVGIAAYRRGRA